MKNVLYLHLYKLTFALDTSVISVAIRDRRLYYNQLQTLKKCLKHTNVNSTFFFLHL